MLSLVALIPFILHRICATSKKLVKIINAPSRCYQQYSCLDLFSLSETEVKPFAWGITLPKTVTYCHVSGVRVTK
jgi:hypothetical protein